MSSLLLSELKADPVAPLQSFSRMPNDTKIRTMRTVKAIARKEGKRLIVSNVESFNHHSGCKKDMFGIIDAVAIECHYCPELVLSDDLGAYYQSFQGTRIRGLQACGRDWGQHVKKLQESIETVAMWLSAGNTTFELWGWRKVKRRGQQVYRPRVQLITVPFLLGKEPAVVNEVFED